MIFPATFEQKLGFDTVRQRIENYCLSEAGRARVAGMQFNDDATVVISLLGQTHEFLQILEKSEAFPSQFYYDGGEWLARIAQEGNYLDAAEFLSLANSLETAIAAAQFLRKSRQVYPRLESLAAPVTITVGLPASIREKIDDKGQVRDSASPDLARIRRQLRDEQAQLRRLADQLFRQAVADKLVPDGALPTIREGRLVIPILAEHKRRMKGFILDESATGQTVYMEPAQMLDSNNEIRDLEHAEKREVLRILKDLTSSLRAHHAELEKAFAFLAEIDFIRAKAKFARETDSAMPVIENRPEIVWYRARHPLLFLSLRGKREVVPLDIELDSSDRMLLVSGPNAGGKSVTLKTVGLLQYMVQCGLLVPLNERSRVGIFRDIFLDIGDQQSIENDLSTYSSHLQNMSVFIRSAGERSLVLLDELGSGTDPNFGGAIAQAVLDALLRKRVWGVATTHYYNLKLFAGQRQGIRNAAMRFDETNMMPLYILDIGKPGSSFALQIARRTGLPQDTLAEAEQLVGKDLAGFETLVRSLESERNELSERIRRLEKQEAELRQSLVKYQTLSSELEARRKEIISKAKDEAAELLKTTNREIEKTIRHIRENKAERKETLKMRKNLQTLKQKVTPGERQKPVSKEPIAAGDHVRIQGQEGSGVVLLISGKTATVQFGELKSRVKISSLERASGEAKTKPAALKGSGPDLYARQATFNGTLDVRGQRAEEVIPQIDRFIDTAILLGQGEVRILHGKGEGILRKVIREHLRKYREVASVADEHVERGGEGVTVVVLK